VSSGMDPTAVAPFADFPQFGTVRPWVLDLLNVRYIVTSADCPSDTVLLDRELRVCDNPQAMERALWVGQAVSRVEGVDSLEYLCGESFDPAYEVLLPNGGATESVTSRAAGDVRIVEYKPHGVVLDVSAPVDGWVVIADAYYPGWQAWVSGEETPVLRADWALRAVSVPAGESRIVLQYRSILFEAGAWISGVSFATVVVLVIRYLTRSRSAIAGAEWAAGDA
jgi:hypothetical protein